MSVEVHEQAVPEGATADPGQAVEEHVEAPEAEAEAGEAEEAPPAKGKASKAAAQAHKFSELRKAQKAARELETRIDRLEAENRQARADLERERDDNKRRWDELKRDYVGTLQREGIPREELLAQQADEASLPPHVRRELLELRAARDEDRKAWRSEIEQIRAERQQEKFERGLEKDIDKLMGLTDGEMHPSFSALPDGERKARIEIAVREAVKTGRAKHLNYGTLLEELDAEVEDIVNHIRGNGKAAREAPERRAAQQPKASTHAVSARGKAAPSASGPMTEAEKRQFAMNKLREKRLMREKEALDKERQKAVAKSG